MERVAGGENGLKFVDKQNYSSFSGRNNFLGIYPGDTLNCSCTGVRNSYDALARARPRIKGGISASRNLRDLSRGKFLTASCCHEFIGFCNFFVVFGLLDENACIWYEGDIDSLVCRKSRYLTSAKGFISSLIVQVKIFWIEILKIAIITDEYKIEKIYC